MDTNREHRREIERQYRERNRERIKERVAARARKLWKDNPTLMAKKQRASRQKTKAKRLAAGLCENCTRPALPGKTKCPACVESSRTASRNYYRKLRDAAYMAYGGAKCSCCGESEPMFLTLDHMDNQGSKHRKQVQQGKKTDSGYMYRWLKRNNYPDGFQVLCYNCNSGKWRNGGVCPHKGNIDANSV